MGNSHREVEDCPKAPVKTDRRERPSYGYRAVHVIVYEDSTPMEIQVRTKLQDTWAQISEKLGDIWGRGLRYGQGPDQPDAPAFTGSPTTRAVVVAQLSVISEGIERIEILEVTLTQLREEMLELDIASRGDFPDRLDRLGDELAGSKNELQDRLDRLLSEIGKQGGAS